jgi:cardiolipin synthase
MDVIVEDESFALKMEEMFLVDLENATEIVLDSQQKLRAPKQPHYRHPVLTSGGGSLGRAAAGAVRVANVVAAAFTNRRVLEPVEARLTVAAGIALLTLAVLFARFPRLLAYPLVPLLAWIATALLYQGYKLHRTKTRRMPGEGKSSRR